LVYFDNGATLKTASGYRCNRYYQEINANIHRGVHTLSQLATDAYEISRGKIKITLMLNICMKYFFTSGTTFGINLVTNGFASILKPGDEVLVSALEHHSNIVPWQMLCERTGAILKLSQ
jgi:cysteine desulfurase/selenocysteine lyase